MNITASCPHCAGQFCFDDWQTGQVGSCPTCQGQITLAAPVTPPPPPAPVSVRAIPSQPQPSARPTSPSPMVITGNIVHLAGTSYQLSQINSVRVKPGRFRPVAFLMTCLLTLGLVSTVFMGIGVRGSMDPVMVTSFLFYAPMLAIALWRFVDGLRRCTLMLTVSSGEIAALQSTNRSRLESIAADLVGAISAR